MGFKKARERAGLSVLEAARALKVSHTAVYSWESGEYYPNAERLPEIADLYKCSTDELLKEE